MKAPDDTITRLRLIREQLLSATLSLRALTIQLTDHAPSLAAIFEQKIDQVSEQIGMVSTLELEIITRTRDTPFIRFTPPSPE